MRRRTIRIPVDRPSDEDWKLMRASACKAARFANLALADIYVATANKLRPNHSAAFARMNDELSGWVRNAMMRNRVRPFWSRSGRDVLAGRQRLACFSADRALTIQADHDSNRGVLYERDGEGYTLVCRFEPVQIRDDAGRLIGQREPVRLRVNLTSPGVRKDWSIREAVEAIWPGAWRPGTITFRFDRRRRKVDALISYAAPDVPGAAGAVGATLGPYVPETGELWLRFDEHTPDGPLNFAHRVNRMREMKEKHEAITHRLRRKMGRGKGRRQAYRSKLEGMRDLGRWLHDRMHEMTAEIIEACGKNGVTELRVQALGEGDLPWHDFAHMLRYKCEDRGMALEEPAVQQDATFRAERAQIQKRGRTIRKARDGMAATTELMRKAG